MSVATIRQGLADALSVIPEVQVSPWVLSEPTPPTMQIRSGEVQYDLTMHRGWDQHTMIVQALVPFSSDIGGQMLLDAWMAPAGPTSVKEAVEADVTLGGACDQVHVTDCSGTQLATVGGVAMLLAEWTCMVYANGGS